MSPEKKETPDLQSNFEESDKNKEILDLSSREATDKLFEKIKGLRSVIIKLLGSEENKLPPINNKRVYKLIETPDLDPMDKLKILEATGYDLPSLIQLPVDNIHFQPRNLIKYLETRELSDSKIILLIKNSSVFWNHIIGITSTLEEAEWNDDRIVNTLRQVFGDTDIIENLLEINWTIVRIFSSFQKLNFKLNNLFTCLEELHQNDPEKWTYAKIAKEISFVVQDDTEALFYTIEAWEDEAIQALSKAGWEDKRIINAMKHITIEDIFQELNRANWDDARILKSLVNTNSSLDLIFETLIKNTWDDKRIITSFKNINHAKSKKIKKKLEEYKKNNS